MQPLTHLNHLQFGWGNKTFNFESQQLPLWVMFEKNEESIGNFKEECLKCVELLRGKNIYLGLSGGIDSEVVARCLMECGVPFTAIIVNLDHSKNYHDIKKAYEFVVKNSIPHLVVNIFFQELLEDAYLDDIFVTDNIFSFLPMRILKFAESHEGFGVIASGEARVEFQNDKLVFPFSSKNTSIYQWLVYNGIKGIPAFYLHTPGIIRSYFNESIFDKIKANGNFSIGPLGHNIKKLIYLKYWPMLESRDKYSGFERFPIERQEFKLTKQKQYGSMIQQLLVKVEDL